MLNQTLLIGRIVAVPELRETESGKKVTNITLAVPKSYRNEEGVREADFITCTAWNNKAEKAAEYQKTGDLVLVTAKVQTNTYEKEGEKRNNLELVVDDISFLSKSRKSIEQEMIQDNDEPEMDM